MNNYIPLNKAVNPVCICEGYQPLIIQTNGVDAMTYNFTGAPSDYATCLGAPEMFIKVEQEGLYYFGVEADDTGSISIGGEQLCEKNGEKPNGKLNLATVVKYLKAGYYKVALSYANNAYDPVSNNAIAFNVTMDRNPIQKGEYSKDSTMKRTFSTSPKIKLWTIEKESDIKCEESKKVELEFEKQETVYLNTIGACSTTKIRPKIHVTVCKDEVEDVWRCRVVSASAGAKITICRDNFRDPSLEPPVTEKEAIDAVNVMNDYQNRGKVGRWHTPAASLAHEEHHCREFEDAFKFYWKDLNIQEELESKTVPCLGINMDSAISFMEQLAMSSEMDLSDQVQTYIDRLPDSANARPYCAGQKALNEATKEVIKQAKAKGWSKVPDKITNPGEIDPPCFKPPVNER